MCNLYSLTKGQAAIRDWFRARHDRTGNLPLFPRIFPDQMAPIVRVGPDGERELVMPAGACRARRNMAVSLLRTFATSRARTASSGNGRRNSMAFGISAANQRSAFRLLVRDCGN